MEWRMAVFVLIMRSFLGAGIIPISKASLRQNGIFGKVRRWGNFVVLGSNLMRYWGCEW
jgi:hypothetical protein